MHVNNHCIGAAHAPLHSCGAFAFRDFRKSVSFTVFFLIFYMVC